MGTHLQEHSGQSSPFSLHKAPTGGYSVLDIKANTTPACSAGMPPLEVFDFDQEPWCRHGPRIGSRLSLQRFHCVGAGPIKLSGTIDTLSSLQAPQS